jgi:hypothetical protein
MAFVARLGIVVAWGVMLALGCGQPSEGTDPEDASSSGSPATDTSPGTTTTTTTSTTTTTTAGGLDTWDTWSTTVGGDSSGGVEDTFFGMSDDMPLVADIPTIKNGVLDGAWVVIEQVRPTSGRATLDLRRWFYVQDPLAPAHMGLRVMLRPGDDEPPLGFEVDLEGYVQHDAQGWRLDLESAIVGGAQPSPEPQPVGLATLFAPTGVALDDSVVEVVEPSPLVVTRRGVVPGTFVVAASSSTSTVLVDLRPFGVTQAMPSPGTTLARLRGVAELGGSRPVLLPRSVDDLTPGG